MAKPLVKSKLHTPFEAERAMRKADRKTGYKIVVEYASTTNKFVAHALSDREVNVGIGLTIKDAVDELVSKL
jgi:hypothetical protein